MKSAILLELDNILKMTNDTEMKLFPLQALVELNDTIKFRLRRVEDRRIGSKERKYTELF